MDHYLLISDAAKEVQVESHVLRYWEEELHLPIRRNELGHRYYTQEDVERFKQIKGMKERGLQLKAIKMILKDGKIDIMMPEGVMAPEDIMAPEDVMVPEDEKEALLAGEPEQPMIPETKEEKARRLQWLLQQMMKETLQENNRELCRSIQESVVKELDYQFRMREEQEEERDRVRAEREEQHYQRLDELLRAKSGRLKPRREKPVRSREAREKETPKKGRLSRREKKQLLIDRSRADSEAEEKISSGHPPDDLSPKK